MKPVAKYVVTLGFIFFLKEGTLAQAVFDTLNLVEFEVVDYHASHVITSKTQTIDSLDMREFNQQDLGEMLSLLAPVYVKSYGRGTLSTVSFRGMAAAHTQVLWEGFRLNSPMLGQVDFSQVPNALFTGAEIKYGGSTLLYSGGAFGGLVSLNSLTPENKHSYVQFEQSVGSFETYTSTAAMNLAVKNFVSTTKVFRQSSANNFTYVNNALLPVETMKQKEANFLNYGFSQLFNLSAANGQEWYIVTWNQWTARDLPPIMTNVFKLQEENQSDFTSRTVLGWRRNTGQTLSEVKAAYFHENFNYYLRTVTSDSLQNTVILNDSRNIINTGMVKADMKTDLGKAYLLAIKLDLEHQSVDSRSYQGLKTRNEATVMVSLEKSFFNWLMVKALVREAFSDGAFLPLLPYLGISVKPFSGADFYVRLNASENYKRPTLNEMYFFPMGNPDLLPERASQVEGSLDYSLTSISGHNLSFDVSAYYSRVHNWIQWLPGEFEYWKPLNVELVESRGVEASAQWKYVANSWTFNAMAQYAYAHTQAQDEEVQQVQMPYIPMCRANGYLAVGWRKYQMRWGTNFTGERFTTLDPEKTYTNTLPSFWLNEVSAGATFKVGKTTLETRIKVYNLFDVRYQAVLWRAMPGRYAEAAVFLKW